MITILYILLDFKVYHFPLNFSNIKDCDDD